MNTHDYFSITFSCTKKTWEQESIVNAMLEDLLFGQTFRIYRDKEVSIPLTSLSYSSHLEQCKEKHERIFFNVRVPQYQFSDKSLSSVVTQLWGNILDYPGFKLELLPQNLVSHLAYANKHKINAILSEKQGPFFTTVLKPSWKLTLKEKVEMTEEFVANGGDFVKEDETYYAPLKKILEEYKTIQIAINKIDTSQRGLGIYVPHLTHLVSNPSALQELKYNGLRAGMISFMIAGFDSVRAISNEICNDWLLWGHRVGYQSMSQSMSMQVVVQLAVIAGLDIIHVGTPTLENLNSIDSSCAIIQTLRCTNLTLQRETFPVFSKTTAEILPELFLRYGDKSIFLACGELRQPRDDAFKFERRKNGLRI